MENGVNDHSTTKFIFTKIFEFLFGNDKAGKRYQLNNVAKLLSKQGYPYYNYKKDLLTPSFADFMFDVYKSVCSSGICFNTLKSDEQLMYRLVRFSIPDDVQGALDSLDENQIRLNGGKMSFSELYKTEQAALGKVKAYFTLKQVARINELCSSVMIYRSFCMFDYFTF